MMQHARADDEIKATTRLGYVFNWHPLCFEIRQVVLSLQSFRVIETRCAEVDADHACAGAAECVLGRLPRSASGHQNVQIDAVRLARPQQVIFSAMAILVVPPLVASTIQIFNRGRIRVIGVELTHRIGAQILCAHISTMHVSRTETLVSPMTALRLAITRVCISDQLPFPMPYDFPGPSRAPGLC